MGELLVGSDDKSFYLNRGALLEGAFGRYKYCLFIASSIFQIYTPTTGRVRSPLLTETADWLTDTVVTFVTSSL